MLPSSSSMKLYVQDFALRIMLSSYIVSVRIMLFRSKTNLFKFKDIDMIGRHLLVIFSINLPLHVVTSGSACVSLSRNFLVVTSQLIFTSSLSARVFPPVPHLFYTV